MNKTAQIYLESGLNPVPLAKGGKIPIRKNWGSPIGADIDMDFPEIGICTGAISEGLEGIDFDLKYSDEPDKLWEDWKNKIPTELLKKLVLCSTINKGYHLLYRTEIVESSRKLAKNEKGEVLIETRGKGGYLKCYPSKGYAVEYGSITNIQHITNAERLILINTSILFDETIRTKRVQYSDKKEYNDPFPKYNEDPDKGIDLLLEYGWTIEDEGDEWVTMIRAGKTEGVSGGYNLDGKFLYVFSTSTEFETEKPIRNSDIYCILKADGDYRKGYAMLAKLGYGKENTTQDESLDNLSFISKDGEDEEKLIQAIEGTIPLGLTFGWKVLDEYYLYKENTLNFILAFEGVGKTLMVLHKLTALSVLYNFKFGVSCGENEVGMVKRMLIEALSGKDIAYFKGKDKEYNKYKVFMHKHFFIFKNEVHYSVEDILKRGEKLKEIHGINGLLIDPFSYYKRPLANVYAYNDDLLSKLNIYSKNVCTVFMTMHPTTEATRAPRDAEGYLKAPTQYDAIGGNIFANRTDHFLVYHRIGGHAVAAMRLIMEIRQYKVKDVNTGGKITPVNESVSLTYKTHNGFTGYFDSDNRNPIYEKWHSDLKELPKMSLKDDIFEK